uniref:Fibrocystin-L-like n=1 Tax=Phallusia mammillata TaxID=59560 RepID=A0A6F9DPE8_9ASCI|nr:fibrocystin-L-like [Phallusia mammillata]
MGKHTRFFNRKSKKLFDS